MRGHPTIMKKKLSPPEEKDTNILDLMNSERHEKRTDTKLLIQLVVIHGQLSWTSVREAYVSNCWQMKRCTITERKRRGVSSSEERNMP